MQFRNGVAVFAKTNAWGQYNIASFHSPRSLTWRWLLSFCLPRREFKWFMFWRSTGGQEKWCLQLFKFRLGWSTQESMWLDEVVRS